MPDDRARSSDHPVTPDGRYFVVRGRLWRRSNPALGAEDRERLVRDLMAARRAVATARRAQDKAAEDQAHADVDKCDITRLQQFNQRALGVSAVHADKDERYAVEKSKVARIQSNCMRYNSAMHI